MKGIYRARQSVIERAQRLNSKMALVEGKINTDGTPLTIILDNELDELADAVDHYEYLSTKK